MKSKSTQKSNETVAPNPTYAPYVNDAANQQQGAYQAAQTNVNQNVMPALQQGMNYYGDELAGKYLNGNPYLDNVLSKTNQDISNGVNSQFEGAGRYGSGNHAGVLADKIAANEDSVRYGNYANERGYMNAAAAGLGSLGALSASLPQAAGSTYANNIGNLVGRYVNGTSNSTTTTTKSPFELWLAAASSAASAVGGRG